MCDVDLAILALGKKGTIKFAIEHKLGVGKVLELKLDGKKGTISVSVELSGEDSALGLEASYTVAKRDGKSFIDVSKLSIDRSWMNTLAHLLIEKTGGSIPIPNGSEKYLKLLK
ncbi:MAG TPA: hypothetical protein PLS25_02415 [Methanoregulaceae archaeon]|nr:hypothetical protein [Methanoregulaceae archaeon]